MLFEDFHATAPKDIAVCQSHGRGRSPSIQVLFTFFPLSAAKSRKVKLWESSPKFSFPDSVLSWNNGSHPGIFSSNL